MYEAYPDKLLNFAEKHAEKVAEQWLQAIRANLRTPSYHSVSADKLIPQAVYFYKNLKKMYMSDKPYEEEAHYFAKYAEDRYKESIPLHEAVYSLAMMRRHLWLYADFQEMFITTCLQQAQAIESLNRMMLMFDYAVYIIIKKYEELSKPKK